MIDLLLSLQKQKLATAIYLFGLVTLLSGPGLKHMRLRSHHDLTGTLVTSLLLRRTWWSTKSPTVYPSQCPFSSFVQMTDTDVAFPPYCRSCSCDRHDLYLPSIPASLQTLGRSECAAACALAPHGLRIISPFTFYLNLLRAIWTFDKKIGSELFLPFIHRHVLEFARLQAPSPSYIYVYTTIEIYIYIYIYIYIHIYIVGC